MSDLSSVKVGDPVMVLSTGWHTSHTRHTVARVLKASVVLDNGSKWRFGGGEVGGDAWSRTRCQPWDEELHQELTRERRETHLKNSVCRFFQGADCRALSVEQWERVQAICNEAKT